MWCSCYTHANKVLLFDGSHIWIKKQGGLFDMTMDDYHHGAEVCDVASTYMLNVLSKKYKANPILNFTVMIH